MHEPTPVRVVSGYETHPAFGKISAVRVSSTPGEVLFDSDVLHTRYIRLTIARAHRQRSGLHDYIHDDNRPLIEVDLSEAQWAAVMSSMNTTGVPCTLRKVGDEWDVPGLEYAPRLAVSLGEVRTAAEDAFGAIQRAMAVVDALDSKATAKEKRAAQADLRAAISNAQSNVNYTGKVLAEHAENVVQKARADIEAVVTQKAQQLGVSPSELGTALELGD